MSKQSQFHAQQKSPFFSPPKFQLHSWTSLGLTPIWTSLSEDHVQAWSWCTMFISNGQSRLFSPEAHRIPRWWSGWGKILGNAKLVGYMSWLTPNSIISEEEKSGRRAGRILTGLWCSSPTPDMGLAVSGAQLKCHFLTEASDYPVGVLISAICLLEAQHSTDFPPVPGGEESWHWWHQVQITVSAGHF